MTNQRSGTKLFFYGLLVAVLLLALIRIVAGGSGLFLYLEVVGLLFLMLLTLLGFVGYAAGWGEKFFFFAFLLYILNLLLLWSVHNSLYLTLLFLTLIGVVFSIPQQKRTPAVEYVETYQDNEPHSEIFDSVEPSNPSKITKKFSPGRYVASRRGKYYHEAKGEWAKKIKQVNQIWFDSKEEAWEQGFKAHMDVN